MKSLGAVEAFDYSSPDCADDIRRFTHNKLKYIWDTIGTPASAKLCADVIVSNGTYGAILKVAFPREDVKRTWSLAYTATGEAVEKPHVSLKAQPQHFEFMKTWIVEVEQLLEDRRIQVHQMSVDKGLENVLQGLDLMRNGKVSGRKLVYTL